MAKSVLCALKNSGFKYGKLVARNEKTGRTLARQYGYEWLPKHEGLAADILINVTPIGMAGAPEERELAFTHAQIQTAHTVFDVVALPAETQLIQNARAASKHVISGAEVIVLQAVEQFVLYTGVKPGPVDIEKAATFARAAT